MTVNVLPPGAGAAFGVEERAHGTRSRKLNLTLKEAGICTLRPGSDAQSTSEEHMVTVKQAGERSREETPSESSSGTGSLHTQNAKDHDLPWTLLDDWLLLQHVRLTNCSLWDTIALQLSGGRRTGQQCRERRNSAAFMRSLKEQLDYDVEPIIQAPEIVVTPASPHLQRRDGQTQTAPNALLSPDGHVPSRSSRQQDVVNCETGSDSNVFNETDTFSYDLYPTQEPLNIRLMREKLHVWAQSPAEPGSHPKQKSNSLTHSTHTTNYVSAAAIVGQPRRRFADVDASIDPTTLVPHPKRHCFRPQLEVETNVHPATTKDFGLPTPPLTSVPDELAQRISLCQASLNEELDAIKCPSLKEALKALRGLCAL